MRTVAFLTPRTLLRAPLRTALVVAGLSITGALLLDMTMLSGGLQTSLGIVLSRLGFAVRVVPKGRLPFSGGAQIAGAERLAALIAARPDVAAAIPVSGGNVYLRAGAREFPAFGLGVPPGSSGVYRLLRGRDLASADRDPASDGGGEGPALPIIINENMARLDGIGVGDRLVAAGAPGAGLQAFATWQPCRVVGVGDFYFDLPAQRSFAVAGTALRRLLRRPAGSASILLVRMTDPGRAEALARWVERQDSGVDAFSLQEFLARTGARLTYFNQFSLILGTISVAVSLLLVAAIVTLSAGERLGEIAMLRAIGFARGRITALIVAEGAALAAAAVPGALLLGVAIARGLDSILLAAPGVPENLHFFTLTPAAAGRTIALLLATGALGGLYPGTMIGRVDVAGTLHREVLS